MLRRVTRTAPAVCLFTFLSLLPASVAAQSAPEPRRPDSQLGGTLVDQAGLPVPGASVSLINKTTGLERVATSDLAGRFRFVAIGPTARTASASRSTALPPRRAT